MEDTMRVQRLIVALLLSLSFTLGGVPLDAAKGTKGSGHSTKSSPGPKTVHVKEYTRKDGTKVKAHDRAAPASKGTTSAKATTPKETKHERTPAAVSVARDANGRITRSESARHAFEVQTGYPKGRPGYVIDHIRPLACGGGDSPSNMQWQTIAAAKAKDRVERIGC
jgi:hypothetical protein